MQVSTCRRVDVPTCRRADVSRRNAGADVTTWNAGVPAVRGLEE